MIKVTLYNRDVGSGTVAHLVQGYSGKSYGSSRFNPARGHHSFTVTVEDERAYERMMDDLAAAWHLPLRKWVPMLAREEEDTIAPPGFDGYTEEALRQMQYFSLANIARRLDIPVKGLDKATLVEAILSRQMAAST